MEDHVTVKCREADYPIIAKHLPDLEEKYELHTKTKVHLTIDSNYIESILPGIILVADNGKVKVNNTLSNRISQIVEFVTPLLSTIFYGTKTFRVTKT